jgi:hypothetical protein
MSLDSLWTVGSLFVFLAAFFLLFDRPGHWLSKRVRTASGSITSVVAVVAIVGVAGLADHFAPIISEEELHARKESDALAASLEQKEAEIARLSDELAQMQARSASIEEQYDTLEDTIQQSQALRTELAELEAENRVIGDALEATQAALRNTEEGLKNANATFIEMGWDAVASGEITVKADPGNPPVALPSSVWKTLQRGSAEPFVLFGIDEKANLTAYFSEGMAEPAPFESLVEPNHRLHLAIEIGERRGCWLSPEGYRQCLIISGSMRSQAE